MDLGVLFSGGKDSNYAFYWALNQGFDIRCLVTLTPRRDDSFMFHKPCIEYVGLQAEALDIPIVQKNVSGVKEEEVAELEKILSELDVEGIVSGAVASEYQKTRIDGICERLGLKSYAPLWGRDQGKILEDIINSGFKVMIVGIAAEGLTEDWLGRVLTLRDLQDLKKLEGKFHLNVAGEGGEYETFVLDGPTFSKRIVVNKSVKRMSSRNSGILEIKDAILTSH